MTETETVPNAPETPEDWFGLIVEDDGTVWGIAYTGETQYHFGADEQFYRDLITAGFPLQCDSGPHGRGHLFADFSIKPSRLPLAVVTAYSEGPEPREHEMWEAAAFVHNWLERHPDVVAAALASVQPSEGGS